jgi:hypothetical protein
MESVHGSEYLVTKNESAGYAGQSGRCKADREDLWSFAEAIDVQFLRSRENVPMMSDSMW